MGSLITNNEDLFLFLLFTDIFSENRTGEDAKTFFCPSNQCDRGLLPEFGPDCRRRKSGPWFPPPPPLLKNASAIAVLLGCLIGIITCMVRKILAKVCCCAYI